MGKIKIKSEKCKGCELCVINCPNGLIELSGPINSLGLKTARFLPAGRQEKGAAKCTGCALCATVCPDCAILVWR